MGEIGSAIQLPEGQRALLGTAFQGLARSYTDLFQSIEQAPFSVLSAPPSVTRMPTEEIFYGASLLEAISVEGSRKIESRDGRWTRERNLPPPEDDFLSLLSSLDPGFVRMWQGALKSLWAVDDPDQVRHYGISLRELLTQVLHQLSPDKEVRSWSQAPEHYHNNQPTRRARLLYICRNIDHDAFHTFVNRDIAATEKLIDVFQQATHEVCMGCTPAQLNALRTKAEHTIRWLVELAREARC